MMSGTELLVRSCKSWGWEKRYELGPLQLLTHVIQNRYAGEQEMHWGMTGNKCLQCYWQHWSTRTVSPIPFNNQWRTTFHWQIGCWLLNKILLLHKLYSTRPALLISTCNRLWYNVPRTDAPAARQEKPLCWRKPDPSQMQRQALDTLREKGH